MALPHNRKGSAAADVVIGAAIIIFVLFPVFSAVIEKYIVLNKAQIIKDAMDMTNISTYNALKVGILGKAGVDIDMEKAENIYRRLLSINLNLNGDLLPTLKSLAEDKVRIKSIIFYTGESHTTCPCGIEINRPSVHSIVIIPIRPSLYRNIILNLMGKQFVELEVHVDSEIPLNK